MAEKIGNDIRKVGEGFFDANGRLKAPERLTREQAQQASSEADSQEIAIQDPSAALRATQVRTSQQVGSALEMNAETREVLKEAKSILNEKADILKELKSDPADQARADELKSRYAELEQKQASLAEEAQVYNAQALTRRSAIQVGNKNFGGEFRQQRIELAPVESADLSSAQGIKAALAETKMALQSVSSQTQVARAQRDEIKQAGQAALKELNSIDQSRIQSEEEASQLTRTVAEAVRGGTVESALSAFNPDRAGGASAIKAILESLMG